MEKYFLLHFKALFAFLFKHKQLWALFIYELSPKYGRWVGLHPLIIFANVNKDTINVQSSQCVSMDLT